MRDEPMRGAESLLFPEKNKGGVVLEGEVQDALFVSAGQDFAILRIKVLEKVVVALGSLAHLRSGEHVQLTGNFEQHAKHGQQFRVTWAMPQHPQTRLGIERYLSTLSGIGPELARRIVEKFGDKALHVLEQQVGRVAQIKGIGKRRAQKAAADALVRRQERELMVFLQGNGVSASYANRIQKAYGESAMSRLRENPYQLSQDIVGIGFRLADQIAQKLGIEPHSPMRKEAAIVYILQQACDQGHTYLPKEVLFERTASLFQGEAEMDFLGEGGDTQEGVSEPIVGLSKQDPRQRSGAISEQPPLETALLALCARDRVVVEGARRVFLKELHRAELRLAEKLTMLAAAKPLWVPVVDEAKLQASGFSKGQQEALRKISQSAVTIVTGGPGTGKTSLIRFLVALFLGNGKQVRLLAPTGRAAKRLSEATGCVAQTIHRALEWNPSQSVPMRKQKLDAALVVCDEASMIDVHVASALVNAIPDNATVVFVGDVEQLPSVGPGDVLRGLIQSGLFAVARLTDIFRQQEGSGIVYQANRVLAGEIPETKSTKKADELGDFYYIETEDAAQTQSTILKLCTERIPMRFHLDPRKDIQVLTPMHRGEVGTTLLNQVLQQHINPFSVKQGLFLQRGANRFAVGDKVMQVRNDYERDVWNGDVGFIESLDVEKQRAEVSFDDRIVLYKLNELDQLELAYAMSIHKSQGSEYPAVVIPLAMEHFLMLQRNLLYTAMTRGKKLVVFVGNRRALAKAVHQSDRQVRYSYLTERLQKIK